jgi:hypothetical protein
MDVNEDFVDIVACLEAEGAEFLIVGAYALAAHGFPRMTGDIDIFVRPTLENSARVYRALLAFGAPVVAHGVTERDFQIEDNIYQMGLPPRRIDIMTSVSGVSFDEASAEAIEGKLGDVTVRFIGKAAQARNKRAAGRPKDLVDAALLEADD